MIGIDAYRELVVCACGGYIYIPTYASIVRPVRNRLIKEKFEGDYKKISREFGISEVLVRQIVQG